MQYFDELPDFSRELSVGRLRRLDQYAQSAEVDVAIAQDVLHKRVQVQDLQQILQTTRDISWKGDSIISWVYRLGGIEAVRQSLSQLPSANSARELGIDYIIHLSQDRDSILDLAKTDQNISVLERILSSALEREDDEVIREIETRLPGIKPERNSHEDAAYGWMCLDIQNYQFKKRLKEKPTFSNKPPYVLPFAQDPALIALDEKKSRGEIPLTEYTKLRDQASENRHDALREYVAYAVVHQDLNSLWSLFGKTGSSGDVFQDKLVYTLGEIKIIETGIKILEGKYRPARKVKPVSEITDVSELDTEFDKEAAKYYEEVKEAGGIEYMVRPATISERAYWLVIRMGQIGDSAKLKQVVDSEYGSTGVKKEAVRQLLLAGEMQFLRGFALKNSVPVNFWENINFDRSIHNPNVHADLARNSKMVERLEDDLPSYVATIVEP